MSFPPLPFLARYQVSFGGDSRTAVAYYHKAITLDPTNGNRILCPLQHL